MATNDTDIAIIGSGPAGLTAAIYAVRAGLTAHVIAGYAWGGQLMFTGRVDNYPGFPDGVEGPELMQRMREQTENQGAVVLDDEVEEFIPDPDATNQHPVHTIKTMNGETITARAVILATGSEPKWLDIPGEQELRAGGVSSCATCDGAFFRGKDVIIVGGGDTAMEETLHLAKLVKHVTVVHRREHLRATQAMVNRVKEQPNVDFALSRAPVRVEGEKKVSGLTVRTRTARRRRFPPKVSSSPSAITRSCGSWRRSSHSPSTVRRFACRTQRKRRCRASSSRGMSGITTTARP